MVAPRAELRHLPVMIRIYSAQKKQFLMAVQPAGLKLGDDVLWIDLIEPTPEEERVLEAQLGIDLPTREEMKDIEPSSRLYVENGVAYMTASLIWKADVNDPEITPVAFILAGNRLITIRYAEPRPFAAFMAYAGRHPEICGSGTLMLGGLLEAIIDRLSEILEKTGGEIDGILKRVFARNQATKRRSGVELEKILSDIALYQNMTSKVRDSLISLARMASFLEAANTPPAAGAPDFNERMRSIGKDIQFLTDHVGLLSANITFMLEASLGLVNIEQNAIIKIFSVAAVVFLPPTLVASIYGMNFADMPELHWVFGYPMAVGLMIASAILPYWWFKQRGWL